MKSVAVCWVFLLGAGALNAQVLLSRRVYAEHGRTWRQLWIADSGSMDFKQLTHSGRDHIEPLCSRDGKSIYFLSDPDGTRSLNDYGAGGNRELWVFDRQTSQERLVWQTSEESGLWLVGITADGDLVIRDGGDLRSLLRHSLKIDGIDGAFNAAAVSPDGRTLAIVTAGALDQAGEMFLADAASGQSRPLGKYFDPAWSPGGTRLAAASAEDPGGLAIVDVATQKEIERVDWPKRDEPPEDLIWSPDQKYVLAGLYGENAGSGDPQNDYFLLDIATRTWTPALTAQKVLWLEGGTALLYLRPVDLTPLARGSKHNVWTTQLAAFDLATHKDTALTTGLVLNDDLSSCGH